MDQIRLSVQEIVNKEFKKSVRGYSEKEVDLFLDVIIDDYENFQKQIEELTDEINKLKRRDTEAEPRRTTTTQAAPVNYDILKRISNLEKAVFGPRVSEESE
ncbi:MAG TPA: cell division regulator GpsB [Pseudogracilibacillus sp.]|nr:cell division regulator GpsB [Pseudogracilibacillus sp.]